MTLSKSAKEIWQLAHMELLLKMKINANDDITYEVEGFKEEVEIPTRFAEYLKSIGSLDGMVSAGIITEKIADIGKAELANIEKKRGDLSIEGTPVDKDTLKAKAFQLFNHGKRPSDPEVKALGIKPNTAYRYYQDWKKTRNHT